MPADNFEHPDLHWFRKIDQHPGADLSNIGEDFCRDVASSLGMNAPRIFWFEAANAAPAKKAFRRSPSWGKGSDADPLCESCEYFRWNGGQGSAFHGYTHFEQPIGIMVNSCCEGADLLRTIAEECSHLYQDKEHGAGWRRNNDAAAEREACEFLRGKAEEIQIFLTQWRRSGQA